MGGGGVLLYRKYVNQQLNSLSCRQWASTMQLVLHTDWCLSLVSAWSVYFCAGGGEYVIRAQWLRGREVSVEHMPKTINCICQQMKPHFSAHLLKLTRRPVSR